MGIVLIKRVAAIITLFSMVSLSTLGTAGAASANNSLTILMYHDLTNDPGQTNSMTITADRFRLDMEFLQEFGFTPLLPAELVAITQSKQQLPAKPVMITFDDGYHSNYEYAYPVLQSTGMKATISVIGHNIHLATTTDAPSNSLTWEEIAEMVSSGVVEIGSHTYNLHNPQYDGYNAPNGINGVMRLSGESAKAYRLRVGSDLQTSIQLITQHTGQQKVLYFSYPFGAYDSWMQPLLNENGILVSTLTKTGKANPAASLHQMPRYRITMQQSVSSLLRQTSVAIPAIANVSVNGNTTILPAYQIDGNNYVRVRDVAMLLKDTQSSFDVQWNQNVKQVELKSFSPYTPTGKENKPMSGERRTVQSLTDPTFADGSLHMVAAYNIDGHTYYKLRSLGDLCGFLVAWDGISQTVMVTA
ncbi:polysaccharide deacetylase family protein [Candidatus Agathobaculum pullicola]|uniref:polysaccharide deacetylase family protein n=1 Tax=Candidatus Agathobaculum pullicola TaxID=2838426 RepID=UPI003F92D505